MAFHSAHFLIFFPIVLCVSWSLRRSAILRQLFLLAASYYFYMSWNATYGLLMLATTALDYWVALGMAASGTQRARRAWLATTLVGNLGVLFVFKYYNFAMDSAAQTFDWFGWAWPIPHHSLLLPVGISFYTFQSFSYTIDVYRGELQPTRSFLKFALFISFFPQLVAGPIVRASTFLPQLESEPRFNDRKAEAGLGRILYGLFRKVCIADVLAVTLVDPVFADPGSHGAGMLLLAMYGYAFQVYYDFSAYSDIAIGAAQMLGYELPENFNRPYIATSIGNFWRRWHLSLSTWLRDYLYFPLGGSRGKTWQTARNLGIVMLLGGLWHGASWGFVIWGALQGAFLAAGRIFHAYSGIDPDRADQPMVSRLARIVVTFHQFALCLIMFRSPDFATISSYYSGLFGAAPGTIHVPPIALLVLLIGAVLEWAPRSVLAGVGRTYLRVPTPIQAGVVVASLLLFSVVGGSATPFIYFQF